jgi:hypothetical protein
MEEEAWLIEISTDEGAKWYTVNSNFTNDPDDALRLCRQKDAEAVIEILRMHELDAFATEHIFWKD